jgi:phage FluMu protein Com
MESIEVTFSYLERSFRHKAPRCPQCGQVYIPEELAKGRMHAVEEALEDK